MIEDATLTRAGLELRSAVLAALTLERFRFMVANVYSAGPAPRSAAAEEHRRAGANRSPGRGAYTREHMRISLRDRHAGQVLRPASWMECPLSISGHDEGGRDGRCTWCGQRINVPVPRPELGEGYRTELDLAYRRHYDPDYGSDPYDV